MDVIIAEFSEVIIPTSFEFIMIELVDPIMPLSVRKVFIIAELEEHCITRMFVSVSTPIIDTRALLLLLVESLVKKLKLAEFITDTNLFSELNEIFLLEIIPLLQTTSVCVDFSVF